MAPRSSRASGADTDTSMAEASEPLLQIPVDPMVRTNASFSVSSILVYCIIASLNAQLLELGSSLLWDNSYLSVF
jgi:hypothetical protein